MKIRKIATIVLLLTFTIFSHAFSKESTKNISFLNQELGVSTYSQSLDYFSQQIKSNKISVDRNANIKEIVVTGKLVSNRKITAKFIYNLSDFLIEVQILVPSKNADKIIGKIVNGFSRKEEGSNSYLSGFGLVDVSKSIVDDDNVQIKLRGNYDITSQPKSNSEATFLSSPSLWFFVGTILLWYALVRLLERKSRVFSVPLTKDTMKFLADCIDLPGHDKVSKISLWANRFPLIVDSLAATFVWYVILQSFGSEHVKQLPIIPTLFFITLCLPLTAELLRNQSFDRSLISVGGAIGVLIGVVSGLHNNEALSMIVFHGAIGAVIGVLVLYFSALASMLIFWLVRVSILVGVPFSWPIKKMLAMLFNSRIRQLPEWLDNQNAILQFNANGVSEVHGCNRRIFVASPQMRRDGQSANVDIPKFTAEQVLSRKYVNSALANAARERGRLRKVDSQCNQPDYQRYSMSESIPFNGAPMHQVLNPATGIPMMGNELGGLDMAGNVWGHDTNPATGLQTIGGLGTDDVAGNSYGYNHNDMAGNVWGHDTNPATGLQTIGGAGTDDVAGNSYGYDHNTSHDYNTHNSDF